MLYLGELITRIILEWLSVLLKAFRVIISMIGIVSIASIITIVYLNKWLGVVNGSCGLYNNKWNNLMNRGGRHESVFKSAWTASI